MMNTINVNGMTIEYTEDATHYSCRIVEHDMYFGSKIEKGINAITDKAIAMVKVKEKFLKDYPQYS